MINKKVIISLKGESTEHPKRIISDLDPTSVMAKHQGVSHLHYASYWPAVRVYHICIMPPIGRP